MTEHGPTNDQSEQPARWTLGSAHRAMDGMRERVLGAIRDLGEHGATCDDVEVVLDMTHQTASARVHELAWAGFIQDSGRQRKTRSGRAAIVWVARRGWLRDELARDVRATD
jgi:hypothetical protein